MFCLSLCILISIVILWIYESACGMLVHLLSVINRGTRYTKTSSPIISSLNIVIERLSIQLWICWSMRLIQYSIATIYHVKKVLRPVFLNQGPTTGVASEVFRSSLSSKQFLTLTTITFLDICKKGILPNDHTCKRHVQAGLPTMFTYLAAQVREKMLRFLAAFIMFMIMFADFLGFGLPCCGI